MNAPRDWNITKEEQEQLNVLAHQSQSLHRIDERLGGASQRLDDVIGDTHTLLEKYDKSRPLFAENHRVGFVGPRPVLRSWAEVVAEAEASIDQPTLIEDLFSLEEIDASLEKVRGLRGDFDERHRLDAVDWSICGVAGTLAALVDIFLVGMPRHPSFLGSDSSVGGPLSNWIRDRINACLTPEQIRELEKEFRVSYDASTSKGLAKAVDGLCPSTHRFQSLGHDPLLCWIFGVSDILKGAFTALDKNGHWVVQAREGWESSAQGMGLFKAIGRVFGHLKSDIATPAGLPVPLMPLLQMFQVGSFGEKGHTLAKLSRIMYRNGYDFRHFLAMSVVPLLVETLVRQSYFAKRLYEGHSFLDAVPFDVPGKERKPKLTTMLFTAHFIASAANAGKVAIGQNPLLINCSQWFAFICYALPQAKWLLMQKEAERHRFVQGVLQEEWKDACASLDSTWESIFPAPVQIL